MNGCATGEDAEVPARGVIPARAGCSRSSTARLRGKGPPEHCVKTRAAHCFKSGSALSRPHSDMLVPWNGFWMVSPFCSQYFCAMGQ